MNQILIIDDQKLIRDSLKVVLEKNSYEVHLAETGCKGLEIIKKGGIELVLLDVRLPDIDGIDVLKKIRAMDPEIIVIMMTGYGTVENAVQAIKIGAVDYINKPFESKALTTIVKLALETHKLKREVRGFQDRNKMLYGTDKIIGQSKSLQKTLDMVNKISQIESSTVLIQGESGTGKELVAKAIHYNSSRSSGPFVEINCSAIPTTLLESELFGYEQGAFTDAKRAKQGLVEQANGGTIFLDEIGDMELSMQSKILNVLQERKFRRLGGGKMIDMDARIIAATNHNLREEIGKKSFRQDLFYRLNVLHINLSPLRERKEDIVPLTKYFIHEFNQSFKKNVRDISQDAMDLLLNYSWPGNVRELRNTIERIMIIENPEIILRKHLPAEVIGEISLELSSPKRPFDPIVLGEDGIDLKAITESFQAEIISEALMKAEGNKSKAAKLLNMDRFSLRYLIKKYHLS
ncbi:MAG: sigma-54 dependent transcriptional regulator [Deltaproteobacteria bacterium]|nr:sigma-54 dependent transcriptional regulator [Deltaproteobacteria bacterium]